ncbi:hypothetical protein V6N13_085348 [Hibiscus sabdariffa]
MSIGSGPLREFEDKFRMRRSLSPVKVEGIEEENILEPRNRFLKEIRLPKQAGITPVNILSSSWTLIKLLKLPISFGMLPLMLHASACNLSREPERFPTKPGSSPLTNGLPLKIKFSRPLQFVKEERKLIPEEVKLFSSKLSISKFLRLPRSSGMDPEK